MRIVVLMAVQMKSLCFCDLGSAHFDRCEVRVHPQTADRSMQTAVNDTACSEPVVLNAGETVVIIKVTSADGTNTQVRTKTCQCHSKIDNSPQEPQCYHVFTFICCV